MAAEPLLKSLHLRGILSFGPDTEALELRPLNVLIGPNGSGKSNFIEAINLLRSSPQKLVAPIRGPGGGGVNEWVWKGSQFRNASIEAVIDYPKGKCSLRHVVSFTVTNSRFELIDERIENSVAFQGHEEPYFYYRLQKGRPVLLVRDENSRNRELQVQAEDVTLDESILSQRRDPDLYPELTYLSSAYSRVRQFREWEFGRESTLRYPQPADLLGHPLEEDLCNLGLFLNHIRGFPNAKARVLSGLRDLNQEVDDFDVRIKGGTVEVVLTEGDFVIPASRLSDGTIRYLCLLAILCDPEPPALICIEEPELGLHPDLIPSLADLLVEASERTQLIVTTHSDILIDSLTDQPESVVVCEKHDGSTQMHRLDAQGELKEFLKKYRLGELWLSGQIGGKRW